MIDTHELQRPLCDLGHVARGVVLLEAAEVVATIEHGNRREDEDVLVCRDAAPFLLLEKTRSFPPPVELPLDSQPCGLQHKRANDSGSSVSWIVIHCFHMGSVVAHISSEKSTSFQSSGRGLKASCSLAHAIRSRLLASVRRIRR